MFRVRRLKRLASMVPLRSPPQSDAKLSRLKSKEKPPVSYETSGFYGCGDRTRICDLRVMRQSQGKIGVISAPICAFYRHSLGGFSIVSVQPCPLFSGSGSKVGQKILKLQNRSCQPVKMFISESVLFSRCSSSGRYSATVKPTTSLFLVIK